MIHIFAVPSGVNVTFYKEACVSVESGLVRIRQVIALPQKTLMVSDGSMRAHFRP